MSECGLGSSRSSTVNLRNFLHYCIYKYGIRSLNDLGCGDLYWYSLEDFPVNYIGYDDYIREEAKERLKENMRLEQCDIRIYRYFRECDLTVCKDVFRHHESKDIRLILDRIKESSTYLLADFNEETIITNSYHKKLNDGDVYTFPGNKVDLRDFIGEPLESTDCNEMGKKHGIWKV